MKARPRHAENAVASRLSTFFTAIGHAPVERVPVLGRTGPDITINEFGLVVDVKSRLSVPGGYLLLPHRGCWYGSANGLIMIRISDLPASEVRSEILFGSVVVRAWLEHMDEWRKIKFPQGISMIVLHRPKLPYGDAVAVIFQTDFRRFRDRYDRALSSFHQYHPIESAAAAG